MTSGPLTGLTFHHTGCLTHNMEQSISFYRDVLGFTIVSEVFEVEEQQVKVCFVQTGAGAFIEFVEPTGDNPALRKILKSNNHYYHIALMAEDIGKAIEQILANGGYLVNRFFSAAFQQKECAFVYTAQMQLVELIQR